MAEDIRDDKGLLVGTLTETSQMITVRKLNGTVVGDWNKPMNRGTLANGRQVGNLSLIIAECFKK